MDRILTCLLPGKVSHKRVIQAKFNKNVSQPRGWEKYHGGQALLTNTMLPLCYLVTVVHAELKTTWCNSFFVQEDLVTDIVT